MSRQDPEDMFSGNMADPHRGTCPVLSSGRWIVNSGRLQGLTPPGYERSPLRGSGTVRVIPVRAFDARGSRLLAMDGRPAGAGGRSGRSRFRTMPGAHASWLWTVAPTGLGDGQGDPRPRSSMPGAHASWLWTVAPTGLKQEHRSTAGPGDSPARRIELWRVLFSSLGGGSSVRYWATRMPLLSSWSSSTCSSDLSGRGSDRVRVPHRVACRISPATAGTVPSAPCRRPGTASA